VLIKQARCTVGISGIGQIERGAGAMWSHKHRGRGADAAAETAEDTVQYSLYLIEGTHISCID